MPTTATLIYTNVPETDYPEWSPGAVYSLNAMVQQLTFTDHATFLSLVPNNSSPLTDLTKWQRTGSTKRWKLHDKSIQSKTTNANSIRLQYRIDGIFKCLALMDVTGTSVVIKQYNSSEVEIYSKTVTLISGSNSSDTLNRAVSDIILTDLISTANSFVDITINAPASLASVGELIFGEVLDFGATQYGAKVGFTDFSGKDQDPFGNYNVVKRAYRKTGDFTVMVPNTQIDFLQTLFAFYRATPLLFVGSDQYASTGIYGFFRDFDITIAYPQHSLCSINIEGLT